jgi:hypothetical protein
MGIHAGACFQKSAIKFACLGKKILVSIKFESQEWRIGGELQLNCYPLPTFYLPLSKMKEVVLHDYCSGT